MNFVCNICWEPLLNQCLATSCGHVFHQRCVLRWMKIKKTCPECRLEEPFRMRMIRWTFPAETHDDDARSRIAPDMFESLQQDRSTQENELLALFDNPGTSQDSSGEEARDVCTRFDQLLQKASDLKAQLNDIAMGKDKQDLKNSQEQDGAPDSQSSTGSGYSQKRRRRT